MGLHNRPSISPLSPFPPSSNPAPFPLSLPLTPAPYPLPPPSERPLPSLLPPLLPHTDVDPLTSGELQVRTALEMCDTTGALMDPSSSSSGASAQQTTLDDLARCAFTQLQQAVPKGLCSGSDGSDYGSVSGYEYDYDVYEYSNNQEPDTAGGAG